MSCGNCGSDDVELVTEEEYLGDGAKASSVKKRCGCGASEVVSVDVGAGGEPRPDWLPDFDSWKKDLDEEYWLG